MKNKVQFSKKIIRTLAQKPAISVSELKNKLGDDLSEKKPAYALSRSLKALTDQGLVEYIESGQGSFARLTKEGKKKASSQKIDDGAVLNPSWDGKWRIVLLDLPESRKQEREALRYLLKKAGFVCLKNSAWISPYPFEHLFANIKKDFGLITELMIIVTDNIDEETTRFFNNSFK